jgi:hypothetical protein
MARWGFREQETVGPGRHDLWRPGPFYFAQLEFTLAPPCQYRSDLSHSREEQITDDCFCPSAIQPLEDAQFPCVCLRHLYAIIEKSPDSELAYRLLLRSATVLERTAENMQRFALRHGGLHMELATEDEMSSPKRALNLLVGQPNVRPVGSDSTPTRRAR